MTDLYRKRIRAHVKIVVVVVDLRYLMMSDPRTPPLKNETFSP